MTTVIIDMISATEQIDSGGISNGGQTPHSEPGHFSVDSPDEKSTLSLFKIVFRIGAEPFTLNTPINESSK